MFKQHPQIHITHNYLNYDLNPGKNLVADLVSQSASLSTLYQVKVLPAYLTKTESGGGKKKKLK